MNQTLSKFKKIRSISEVLEDGFSFLQKHFVNMLKMIWQSNKYYLIVYLVLAIFYYYKYSNLLDSIFNNNNNENFALGSFVGLVFAFFSVFVTARMYAGAYAYIRSYIENNGQIELQYISDFIDKKWWGYVLLSLLSGIIILIGFVFLIIPGIALIVPISIAFPVYFMEDTGITESISKAFSYIKGRWWYSFGIIVMLFVIILILDTIVSFPLTLYTVFKVMTASKTDMDAVAGQTNGDLVFIILNGLTLIGKLIISIIQIPVMVFLYFSLKEYQTAEGTLEKINQIGEE